MKRIVVFGSINYDIFFQVDRLPVPGETYPATSVAFEGGGKGANQAVQAALLGAPTELIGAVGNDAPGADLVERLRRAGVGVSHVYRLDTTTGVGVVSFLPDGTVAATIGRGANFAVTEEIIDMSADLFTGAAVAIFQLENPPAIVARAATVAAESGCTVILNAAPACDIPQALVEVVDILVVNEVEAAFYLDESEVIDASVAASSGRRLQENFDASVIITLGSEGSYLFDKAEPGTCIHIPARAVRAVETTGAGDSYVGAMAVALADGRSIREAAEYGTLASSITVQGVGAQGSMPDVKTIDC